MLETSLLKTLDSSKNKHFKVPMTKFITNSSFFPKHCIKNNLFFHSEISNFSIYNDIIY